jgi:two-component system phosphate regulon response regulator PhoB
MSKIIHIVEDDEDIRFVIIYILRENGYIVQVSGSIDEFKTQKRLPPPDLILLDVMLPDGNGIELCHELKTDTETSSIPIIIMSAHATEQSAIAASQAQDFISKPFDLEELIALVKKHIGG